MYCRATIKARHSRVCDGSKAPSWKRKWAGYRKMKDGGITWILGIVYVMTGIRMMVKSAWQQYKDGWYYLGIDGAMLTGLQTIDDKWYYFDQDGRMAMELVLLTPDREGALHYTELKK